MKKNFGDKSLLISYIQQMLAENYNSKVNVNSEYYRHFDMNYGLAHFIAKYLDYRYPLLDRKSINDYNNITGTEIRSIKKPISIMNYFLSDNKSKKLEFQPQYDKNSNEYESKNKLYSQIYNKYMVLVQSQDEETHAYTSNAYEPAYNNYIIKNDMPLFSSCTYNQDTQQYTYDVNNNIIFTLSGWNKEKEICELDDFVTSYLIGRTITPQSSMEDIYYVQKLLIHDRNITREEKGVWCIQGAEGTEYDLTQTIINYQSNRVNALNADIFVTGYFDIYTEAYARKEFIVGDENAIYGI